MRCLRLAWAFCTDSRTGQEDKHPRGSSPEWTTGSGISCPKRPLSSPAGVTEGLTRDRSG